MDPVNISLSIVFVILVILLIWLIVKRQTFENTADGQKARVANMIIDMLNNNISYDDYLHKMTTIDNTSTKVLEMDIFNDMQRRSRNRMLRQADVINYMSDWI